MGKAQRSICRICLEECVDSTAVEDYMKDVFDILLLKINLTVSKKPVKCENCTAMLMRCFDFKAMCFYTHDFIVPFLDDENISKLDLKKVYVSKLKNVDIPVDHGVCGLCMGLAKKCTAVFFDNEEGDLVVEKLMEKYLPELDFSTIEEPMICVPCYESLKSCFRFVTNSSIVEKKIIEYHKLTGADVVDIADILQWTSRNVLKVEDGSTIQTIRTEEIRVCIDIENVDKQVGYDNGSSVRIEVQKLLQSEDVEIKTDQHDFDRDLDDVDNRDCSKSKTYKCDLCSFRTKYFKSLTGHLGLHKNCKEIEVYCCDRCSYQTRYEMWFKRHSLQHKNPSEVLMYRSKSYFIRKNTRQIRMYKCGSCSFQTKYKIGILNHMTTHKRPSEPITYQCPSCSFKTKYKNSLHGHMSMIHKDPSKITMYQCNSCDFKTRGKIYLRNHMMTHKLHSETTLYQCDSCDFKTKYKRCLPNHMITHKLPSEITMYQCDSCGFKTKHKTSLINHMITHKLPSETPMYQCDSCDFKTKHKSCVNQHMITHKLPSETTMYQCDSCGFKTKRKSCLPKHMISHKPPAETTMYRCDSCSYQTKYKSGIQRHMVTHKLHRNNS